MQKPDLGRDIPAHALPELQKFKARSAKTKKETIETKGQSKIFDEDTTMDFVHGVVLEDLENLSLTDKKGAKRFFGKHVPGLGDRRQVRIAVEKWYEKGHKVVKDTVEEALKQGCKLTLGADAWRNKGTNRRHFLALLAWWTSPSWEQVVVCLGVQELEQKADHKQYMNAIDAIVTDMGVKVEDTMAFISDHEGALRLATTKGGYNVLGCFCHGVQLPPRHLLPPTRERKKVQTSKDDDESSSSSCTSSDSSDTDADTAPAVAKKTADAKASGVKRKRQVYEPEECRRLCEAYTPIFRKSRAIIKWHIGNDVEYNSTEKEAHDKERPFKRFCRETPTRWASQEDSLAGVLYNDQALRKKREDGTYRGPPLWSEEECRQAAQLCGVLSGHKVATKMLDREDEGAAACQPVWTQVINHLENNKVPLRADCGPWGYQPGGPKFYREEDLTDITKRTAAWLKGDTRKTYDKFNKGAASEAIQRRCSFLDPRYKALKFLPDEAAREIVKEDVKKIIVERHRCTPEWVAMEKTKADKDWAEKKEAEKKAKDPDEKSLSMFKAFTLKSVSKKGKPELRTLCEERGLDSSGYKPDLIARLIAYKPSITPPAEVAAAESEKPPQSDGCFGEDDLMDGAQPGPDDVPAAALDLMKEVRKEIKKYLTEPTLSRGSCPRQWWKNNESRYPLLAVAARDHLSIPGSSSSLERLFSRFGLVVNPRRNRIKSKLAIMVIFCHENIRRQVF